MPLSIVGTEPCIAQAAELHQFPCAGDHSPREEKVIHDVIRVAVKPQ